LRTGVTCNAIIVGQDEDTATQITSMVIYNAMAWTTGTAWSNVGSWSKNSTYYSIDFSSEVESIVGRGGWASGNALGITIKDNGSSVNASRQPYWYEKVSANAAKFNCTYTAAAASDIASVNGVALASIASINGVAIANIAAVNGVANV
jgi:hypothetical protein